MIVITAARYAIANNVMNPQPLLLHWDLLLILMKIKYNNSNKFLSRMRHDSIIVVVLTTQFG